MALIRNIVRNLFDRNVRRQNELRAQSSVLLQQLREAIYRLYNQTDDQGQKVTRSSQSYETLLNNVENFYTGVEYDHGIVLDNGVTRGVLWLLDSILLSENATERRGYSSVLHRYLMSGKLEFTVNRGSSLKVA